MSALAHMKSLSTFGGKVGDAIKQAEQAISDNEYLSPQSAKWVRASLGWRALLGLLVVPQWFLRLRLPLPSLLALAQR